MSNYSGVRRMSKDQAMEMTRKVFHLRDNLGYTYKEIAEETGMSSSWISKCLNDPETKAKFAQMDEVREELETMNNSIVVTHALKRKDYDIIIENTGGEKGLDLLLSDFFHQIKLGRVQIIGNQPNWGVLDESGLGDSTKSADSSLEYIEPENMFTE